MERRAINPWRWQDEEHFVQANEVSGMQRMLIVSGQSSVDAEAKTLHAGDMRAQIVQAMENLQTVLEDAGYELSDVVSLNCYTTHMDRFYESYDALAARLEKANCWPASTLLGVDRLAYPDLLVEIEATAAA